MKEKKKPYDPEVENESFINPKRIIILFILAEAGNFVLGITELNKHVHSFTGDIPEDLLLTVLCGVLAIVLLKKFCIEKLPDSYFFDDLRLASLFIIVGFAVKLFNDIILKSIPLSINLYTLPTIAIEEIYIIAGIIGFIVLLKSKYKQYSLKELIRGERNRTFEEEPVKKKSKTKNKWVISLIVVFYLLGIIGLWIAMSGSRKAAKITIINNSDQPTKGLRVITTASIDPEPSIVAGGIYVPVKIFDFYGIPVGKSISIDWPLDGGLNEYEEYPRYYTVRIEESEELRVEYNDRKRDIHNTSLVNSIDFKETEMKLTGIVIDNTHEAVLCIEGNAQDGYRLVYDHDNKPLFIYEKKRFLWF